MLTVACIFCACSGQWEWLPSRWDISGAAVWRWGFRGEGWSGGHASRDHHRGLCHKLQRSAQQLLLTHRHTCAGPKPRWANWLKMPVSNVWDYIVFITCLCSAPTAPVCRSLAVSQSAEEATEAIEVSEEAGPNENADSTLGSFTEHVFTDNTHRYLTYNLLNHKNFRLKCLTNAFIKTLF